jgi:hypothetical protein
MTVVYSLIPVPDFMKNLENVPIITQALGLCAAYGEL